MPEVAQGAVPLPQAQVVLLGGLAVEREGPLAGVERVDVQPHLLLDLRQLAAQVGVAGVERDRVVVPREGLVVPAGPAELTRVLVRLVQLGVQFPAPPPAPGRLPAGARGGQQRADHPASGLADDLAPLAPPHGRRTGSAEHVRRDGHRDPQVLRSLRPDPEHPADAVGELGPQPAQQARQGGSQLVRVEFDVADQLQETRRRRLGGQCRRRVHAAAGQLLAKFGRQVLGRQAECSPGCRVDEFLHVDRARFVRQRGARRSPVQVEDTEDDEEEGEPLAEGQAAAAREDPAETAADLGQPPHGALRPAPQPVAPRTVGPGPVFVTGPREQTEQGEGAYGAPDPPRDPPGRGKCGRQAGFAFPAPVEHAGLRARNGPCFPR